ncbi:MAG TPA: TetR/AcrR family transcriptional regulator, partial [Streptosporangiaceae bacterium]|nr:TetR/AcrR family transcriptional regulator [Streptosporangiaceae bacterium]
TARRPSARERLLDAADELFYEEGIHIVGIDRVIEKAGVAKASLYSTFGSKDELVRAYLNRKYEQRRTRITEWVARYDTPRDKLLGVFDALGESIAQPGYHGCAFANATAESSRGSAAEQVTQTYRAWMRALFTDLAGQAGAADPATLGAQLHLLYDGVNWAARIDRDLAAAGRAQAAAAALLDAQLSGTTA